MFQCVSGQSSRKREGTKKVSSFSTCHSGTKAFCRQHWRGRRSCRGAAVTQDVNPRLFSQVVLLLHSKILSFLDPNKKFKFQLPSGKKQGPCSWRTLSTLLLFRNTWYVSLISFCYHLEGRKPLASSSVPLLDLMILASPSMSRCHSSSLHQE